MSNLLAKEVIVANEYNGQRIDSVLAQIFPDFSRSQLSQWIKEGAITLNQQACKPKDKVYGGEHLAMRVVQHDVFDNQLLAEDIPLHVIFEDDHLLIINKPAGLVVHPGAGNREHTLVNALLHHEPMLTHLPRAGIVHRLDKDTTGLLIIAKTLLAHTSLIRQMQAREIQRQYLALVYGQVIGKRRLETFYGRHPRNRLKMAVCKQGKEAITEFAVHKQYGRFTLLEVKLLTGRTHQIRVHMAYINHAVVGDQLYAGRAARVPAGSSAPLSQALQQFKRQALHAYFLSVTHPNSQEYLTFKAPLPEDFQSLLTTMDNYLA